MRKKVGFLAALAVCSGALAAPPDGPVGPGLDLDRMAIILDLTAEQKVSLDQALKAQRQKMRTEMESSPASGTWPSREEMQDLHRRNLLETLTSLQGVLTPDQLRKLEALMDRPFPPDPPPE